MGSCSSGGPNKFSEMCLMKGTGLAKEYAPGDRQAFMMPGFSSLHQMDSSSDKRTPTDAVVVDSYYNAAARLPSPRSGEINSRYVPSPQRRVVLFEDELVSIDRDEEAEFVPVCRRENAISASSTTSPSPPHCQSLPTTRSLLDDSELDNGCGGGVLFSSSKSGQKNRSSKNSSHHLNQQNQQRPDGGKDKDKDKEAKRKVSAPAVPLRWPGEYGNCIVAPPNRTVYDAVLHQQEKQAKTFDQQQQQQQQPSNILNRQFAPPQPTSGQKYCIFEKGETTFSEAHGEQRRGRSSTAPKNFCAPPSRQQQQQQQQQQKCTENAQQQSSASQRLLNILASPMKPLNHQRDPNPTKYPSLNEMEHQHHRQREGVYERKKSDGRMDRLSANANDGN